MPFSFYPNHEHNCPNVSHCPHLGGAAFRIPQRKWALEKFGIVDTIRSVDNDEEIGW